MSPVRWKSISVVIADPFRREQLALSKAAAIARRCGATLTLFNPFMLPQPTPEATLGSSKRIVAAAVRERRGQLQILADRVVKGAVKVRGIVEWDYPIADAIVRHVLEAKPDLLVAESHRHSKLGRWLLANTDWELIRSCPCPLWFVRSEKLPRSPKVLVAVDPRHAHAKPARLDDRLLSAAATLVEQLGGSVAMAHAYLAPVTSSPGTFMEPIRVPISSRRAREFVADTVAASDRLAERHGIAARARFIKEGDTIQVLSSLAKQLGTDVLAMGAVSRSRLAQPFIGNTAEKVIDEVNCDVLVVKPAGFKSPVTRAKRKL